jgi:uncharacterized membrane protein
MDQSREVTRLEGFSDAVFGFAITLLVVSLEVPSTFDELLAVFRGLPVFAVTFAMLLLVWHEHHEYFRKVPLQDGPTVWLNGALLFVVMIYIYPLKFLFALLAGPGGLMRGARDQQMIRVDQLPTLMLVYGLGFMAIFALLAAMYARGWRKRLAAAGPGDEQVRHLKEQIGHCFVYVGVGGLSIGIAAIGGPYATGWSGMIYGLLGPAHGVYHGVTSRRRRRRASAAAVTPAGPGSGPG